MSPRFERTRGRVPAREGYCPRHTCRLGGGLFRESVSGMGRHPHRSAVAAPVARQAPHRSFPCAVLIEPKQPDGPHVAACALRAGRRGRWGTGETGGHHRERRAGDRRARRGLPHGVKRRDVPPAREGPPADGEPHGH